MPKRDRRPAIARMLLTCGLSREEFDQITPRIVRRNVQTARITGAAGAVLGLVFLAVALTVGGSVRPYLFLICGEALVLALLRGTREAGDRVRLAVCYLQLVTVVAYATVLSMGAANQTIPGTSIIVFLCLMPITLNDRPLRMFAVTGLLAACYLCLSHGSKTPEAFVLDVENAVVFTVLGLLLYLLISNRVVREISQSQRVQQLQSDIITTFAMVVEERDQSTGDHIERTSHYVRLLAGAMERSGAFPGLDKGFYDNVVLGAPMHDIGKIKIPDHILNKPGKLTAEEFEVMKAHTLYGYEIIQKTRTKGHLEEAYLRVAANMTRHHHERFDGGGYPDGLAGESIPLEARMMALSDVYDALTSQRVYKPAFPPEKARDMIAAGRGTQFDPQLTDLFLRALDQGA